MVQIYTKCIFLSTTLIKTRLTTSKTFVQCTLYIKTHGAPRSSTHLNLYTGYQKVFCNPSGNNELIKLADKGMRLKQFYKGFAKFLNIFSS